MAELDSTDLPPSRDSAPDVFLDSSAHRLLPAVFVAALVVLSPLPFGSAHGWSLWCWQAVSLSAAGLLIAFEGAGLARMFRPLLRPALLLLGVVALQLVPLPLAVLRWLSPTAAATYGAMVDSQARWFAASANPHATIVSIVRLSGLAAAFFVVAAAPLPGRRSLFHWSILLAGAIAATFSWWHFAEGWDTQLFGEFNAYQSLSATPRLHWPLLNPNHFAAAMNVTWLVALGAFLDPGLLGGGRVARESDVQRTFALVVVLLAGSAAIFTYSRGALAAAVAGVSLLALAWPSERASAASRTAVLAARAVALAILVIGLAWLVLKSAARPDHATVLSALQRQDATLQVRLEVMRQGFRMFRDFPLIGSGLGTWGDAFPLYQRYPLVFATVSHAHSDPLEWLTDIGVVGFAALVWAAVVFVRERRGAGGDEGARRRAVLIAATGSLLVHATGDFALRVPSIALVAVTMLGLLWREGESTSAAVGPTPEARDEWRFSGLEAAAGAAAIVLLVYLASWEWRDERLLARLAAKETITAPESVDWRVREALSRRLAATREPALEPALRAVWSAPASARAHHALAYGYASDVLRERELRRTVACEPATRFWRLEHALSLAALGRFPLARKEIEEAFYFDPQYGDDRWLSFQDPIDHNWPFLDAALRGVRRRQAETPEVAHELVRFEALRQMLTGAYERKTHGG